MCVQDPAVRRAGLLAIKDHTHAISVGAAQNPTTEPKLSQSIYGTMFTLTRKFNTFWFRCTRRQSNATFIPIRCTSDAVAFQRYTSRGTHPHT
jgi:hypothetical protein